MKARWLLLVASAGCSSNSAPDLPATTSDAAPDVPETGDLGDAATSDGEFETGAGDAGPREAGTIGGSRPVSVHVPPGYVDGVPAPLVIMLHGYTASGALEESYLNLTAISDERGFLYAYPDGTVDGLGNQFWNATDACCGVGGAMVDDSEYLSGVIREIEASYTVDAKKVFLVGHSNGGFMAYRMACDHADQIAAVASLAGAMFADVALCHASKPVSVLQIHGTADTVILFGGGAIQGRAYPSAAATTADWATIDGCASAPDTSALPRDLESGIAGDETTVTAYTGCQAGGHAELWTIQGGAHIPALSANFSRDVVAFLFAHAKP